MYVLAEKSLLEIINSTSLDREKITDMIELLNQKLDQGEWTLVCYIFLHYNDFSMLC